MKMYSIQFIDIWYMIFLANFICCEPHSILLLIFTSFGCIWDINHVCSGCKYFLLECFLSFDVTMMFSPVVSICLMLFFPWSLLNFNSFSKRFSLAPNHKHFPFYFLLSYLENQLNSIAICTTLNSKAQGT